MEDRKNNVYIVRVDESEPKEEPIITPELIKECKKIADKYPFKHTGGQPVKKRIYEDDNWVIDLVDGDIRVSYFEDGHFVDEIILSGDDFKEL